MLRRNTPTPRETELFAVELLNGGSGIAFRSCLQTYVGLNPKKKNKVRSASLTHSPTRPHRFRFRSSDRFPSRYYAEVGAVGCQRDHGRSLRDVLCQH
jgi:hypothetical protein